MSSSAGLRRTRSTVSAGSSHISPVPSFPSHEDSGANSQAGSKATPKAGSKAGSRAGSVDDSSVSKRPKQVGGFDQTLYGSEAVTAAQQQLGAAQMGVAVGGIESAIGRARKGKKATPRTKARQPLAPVPEETLTTGEPAVPKENLGTGEPAATSAPQTTPGGIFEPTRMITVADEESVSDPNDRIQSFQDIDVQDTPEVREPHVRFFWSAKQALSLFLVFLAIILAFADLYRGPLLGAKYDLFGTRSMLSQVPTNQTANHTATIFDLAKLHHRIQLMEEHLQEHLVQVPKEYPAQVNFFSPTKGAVVNPELSSPQKTVPMDCNNPMMPLAKAIPEPFWKNIFNSEKKCKFEFKGPPASVFLPWDDALGANWCAPPSRDFSSLLQLQVILGAPVSPTELVVEHNPKAAELYRVAAPKEIELWMDIPNDEDRFAVWEAFDSIYPPSPTDWPPRGYDDSLPSSYAPVGRWEYAYHTTEHIQRFPIEINLRGVSSYNVALRVKSTWNNNMATCLYRIRLHGGVGPVSPVRESWLRPDLPRSHKE
ncbi:MAG: hypothetical protein LQ351_007248 [Letrouitia transgressa]|nr:MAG: hypothetical protein LQ351_007248 [Letrouitia transgressa]